MPPVRIEITVPQETYEAIEEARGDVPRAAWIKRAIEQRLEVEQPVAGRSWPRMKGCSTGKRIYGSERVANRAVTEAAKRGELPPMRHYLCDRCGHWHLSRKRRPPGQRDNA